MPRFISPSVLFKSGGVLAAAAGTLGILKVGKTVDASCRTACNMRAVLVEQFGDESKLKVVSLPVPEPKKNEVLLQVESIGVNPVEVMIRKGFFGDMIPVPYTPGTDVAGLVEKVGPGVTKFKKGDRVYAIDSTSGAYAQYCTAPAHFVSHLSPCLSFNQGAAIGLPYTVAYKALFIRADGQCGETVFVHGASGAVGLAAVQMAKAQGLTVIGTAGSESGLRLVKKCGADFVFNHNDPGYMDKVKASTCGRGANVILEMLANKNLVSDLEVVAQRGRIVVIGNQGSIKDFNPSMTMMNEASILGMVVQVSSPEEYQEMLTAINAGQTSWVKPQIAMEYTLDQVADAHRDTDKGGNSQGKRVIRPNC